MTDRAPLGQINTNPFVSPLRSYNGTYSLLTEEKLGATPVNSMKCTGTSAITVDVARPTALQGTLTCSYSGSLAAFDRTQTAQIEGKVAPNGAVTGTIKHTFQRGGFDPVERTFTYKGTLSGGSLVIEDKTTNRWYPHPMSAVAWTVELKVQASK